MEENWWAELYDELLAEVLLKTTSAEEIAQTVNFLVNLTGLSPGARFFDQCCGTGRISIALGKAGYPVVGIDQASIYIDQAKEAAREQGLGNTEFTAADAFTHVVNPPCDAVFNWWTSFGYKSEDLENRRMIERAFESLMPGRIFALDFMNVPAVISGFKPIMENRVQTSRGEIKLIRESELDLNQGVMRKCWKYRVNGEDPVIRHSAVRLYDRADLTALFDGAGFEGIEFFGDLDAEPLNENSPRCIVTGRKPE